MDLCKLTETEAFERNGMIGPRLQAHALDVLTALADGYARGQGEELAAGLTEALGAVGRIRSLLCLALDDRLVSEPDFQRAREEWEGLSRRMGSFRSYLRTGKRSSERSGEGPENSRSDAPTEGRGEGHRQTSAQRYPAGPRDARSSGGGPTRQRPSA